MKSGVNNIIGGVVLILMGFFFGHSVFLGNPRTLDYIFDGLGVFLIVMGVVRLINKKGG
jgi:hypothetical protein